MLLRDARRESEYSPAFQDAYKQLWYEASAERDAAREQVRAYEEAIRTAMTDLRLEDIPRIVIHARLAAVYRAALPDSVKTVS